LIRYMIGIDIVLIALSWSLCLIYCAIWQFDDASGNQGHQMRINNFLIL
jgi:hypothetical protein